MFSTKNSTKDFCGAFDKVSLSSHIPVTSAPSLTPPTRQKIAIILKPTRGQSLSLMVIIWWNTVILKVFISWSHLIYDVDEWRCGGKVASLSHDLLFLTILTSKVWLSEAMQFAPDSRRRRRVRRGCFHRVFAPGNGRAKAHSRNRQRFRRHHRRTSGKILLRFWRKRLEKLSV